MVRSTWWQGLFHNPCLFSTVAVRHNRGVSRTKKDSHKIRNTVLEVVKRGDGAFDLLVNGKIERSGISERYLPEQLCVRFGFCGEEYEAILRELNQNDRKEIAL